MKYFSCLKFRCLSTMSFVRFNSENLFFFPWTQSFTLDVNYLDEIIVSLAKGRCGGQAAWSMWSVNSDTVAGKKKKRLLHSVRGQYSTLSICLMMMRNKSRPSPKTWWSPSTRWEQRLQIVSYLKASVYKYLVVLASSCAMCRCRGDWVD